MSLLPFSSLFGLAFLALPVAAAERIPPCESGTRYIELSADGPNEAQEVCIRPGQSSVLLFDSKLARVDVEGRHRFRRVEQGESSLLLVASDGLSDGARVPVSVSFQDGAAPASATFLLIVHPSLAERQVEVSRHARTLASYRQGEQQARDEVRSCRRDLTRLQAEFISRSALTGLLADDWMDERGVWGQSLDARVHFQSGALTARKVTSYRAVGSEGQGRVAVQMGLFNPGPEPWTPAVATLVGGKGDQLLGGTVWPLDPIASGETRRIVVEWSAGESEAQGTFTLELRPAEPGAGSVRLEGLTFPGG